MIKESIYQEDLTIKNTNAPNNRAPEHTKQKNDRTEGRNSSTIIVDFSTSLAIMHETTR